MKKESNLLARMRRQRNGSVHPVFEYLADIDPEFLTAYNELAVLNFNYGERAKGSLRRRVSACSAAVSEAVKVMR